MTESHKRSDESTANQHRRMAIFAGPHKSASSSVQELFIKFASNDPNRKVQWNHPSLRQWVWPWNPRRRSYQPRKGFAPLVMEGIGYHQLIWDTILEVWNATDPNTGEYLHPHMIWGTEELDRFGRTPWSGRNGLEAMKEVVTLTHPSQVDIVVNFRRPRQAQWISIWKQLMRKVVEGRAYGDFLCDPKEYLRIWEYLDCVANPLGLVEALLNFWDQQLEIFVSSSTKPKIAVHLLDMEGISSLNRDVGHALACDVLEVNCTTDHWLPNVERPILKNVKSGNPELTDAQMDGMEWLLRQRDCSYRPTLVQATKRSEQNSQKTLLYLHYADTLWDACFNQDSASILTNTTYLLDLLQSQVGCGSLPKTAISDLQESQRQQDEAALHPLDKTIRSTLPQAQTQRSPSNPTAMIYNQGSISSYESHGDIMQTARTQLLALCIIVMLVLGFFFKRLKCRNAVAQRRLTGRHQMAKWSTN